VRTTLRIDDDVFKQLRRRAATEGLTLSALVNRALRQSLSTEKRSRRAFRQKTRDLGRASFDVTRANAIGAALTDETSLARLRNSS
jgi:plasmid stability protein